MFRKLFEFIVMHKSLPRLQCDLAVSTANATKEALVKRAAAFLPVCPVTPLPTPNKTTVQPAQTFLPVLLPAPAPAPAI